MYLNENIGENILGSPSKIRILITLLKWSEGELTERQLAGLCELSTFGVRHALADLERSLIVTKKVVGKANIWRLNRESFAFKVLKPVLDQLITIKNPLAYVKNALVEKLGRNDVAKIILFGSALEEDAEANDIDVCIILKPHLSSSFGHALTFPDVDVVEGIRLEAQIFTAEEWKQKISSPLGQAILKGKEIYPREEI